MNAPALPGFGALRSTANDLLKYLSANMDTNGGPLGKVFTLTHVSRRPAWHTSKIGLGWMIGVEGDLVVPDIIWHGGNSYGYCSFVGFDRVRRVAVVVLANTTSNVRDIGLHLLDERLPLDEDPPVIKSLQATLRKRLRPCPRSR